jgi:fermentation-respiration switch protein FrsA (DUF1100 family)
VRLRKKKETNLLMPLVVGGAALTAIDVARRLFRHTQLFCPSPDPVKSWDPADYGVPRDSVEEHWIETPDGEVLHAWYCRSPHPIASALYCHGNTGNLTLTAEVIPHFLSAGINVLYFDYRGFGRSSGLPSINGVVADGVTAARFHERIRPKALPSILYGYSLGGAVAAQVIKRHPFDGLILQSTFTSLPAITRVIFPAPMHILAGNLFDTLGVVKRLTVPLLVIHGGSDEVVPCSMAHELFAACTSPKHIEIVDGGLHKDLYTRDCRSLIAAVNRFAASLPNDTRAIPLGPEEPDDVVDRALRYLRRRLRSRTAIPQTL